MSNINSITKTAETVRIFPNAIVTNGRVYPEIPRETTKAGYRITMQTTKDFLFEHGYISATDWENSDCSKSVITRGIYQAFCDGVLSLNCTKQDGVSNLTPVRVSTGLSGKLDTVFSISTMSLVNTFCMARMEKQELVCSKCYVPESLRIDGILMFCQNMYILTHIDLTDFPEWVPVMRAEWAVRTVVKKLQDARKNGKIEISDEEIATLAAKKPLCRLESMGDLACTLQARNYLTITRANDTFDFALWTKNPAVLATAIDMTGKPENLSTVLSMSRKNVMDPAAFIVRYSRYFDHMFLVVDGENYRDHFLGRSGFYTCHCEHFSCLRCRHCYTRSNAGDIDTAIERLREKKIS